VSVEQQSHAWRGPRAPGAGTGGAEGAAWGQASEPFGLARALERFGPWALLLSVVAAAAALAAAYGLRIHGLVIFDETLSVVGGRYINQFPNALFETSIGVFPRGPERLTPLLLALGNTLSGHTGTQLQISHVLIALGYAAAAIPSYGIARLVGLGRWWAVGAGALAVCTPLLVFGTTLLNTSLSLLTAAIALWAYLRCLLRPSWQADALAILATGLMASARVSYGGLGVALLIAIVVQAWRDARPRARAPKLLLDHWLLLAVALAALVYVAVRGAGVASGYGGVSASPFFSGIWNNLRYTFGQLSVAYALAPFAIAVAWVVRAALRSRERAIGAFATLAIATFVVLAYVNQGGDLEPRYIVALLPLTAVAVVAPLARRELRWLEVGIAGLLVARAVATTQTQEDIEGFAHFLATTDTWFADVWLGRTGTYLPLGASAILNLITVGAAAVAVALAVAAKRARRHWTWIAGVVIVATAATGFIGAWYSASKFAPSVAGLSTIQPWLRPASFAQAAFVDERVHQPVGVLDYMTNQPGIPQQWTSIELFNGRVRATVRIDGQSSGFNCCFHTGTILGMHIDQNTGAVTVTGGALPPYLLSAAQWTPGALVTELLTTSPFTNPAVSVERVVSPARAAWTGPGVPADGWGIPGQTMRLRVFPAALASLRRPCLDLALTAPPLPATGALGVTAGRIHVTIPPRVTVSADVPLARAARRPQDILIQASRSGIRSDGAHATVGLWDVRVAPCPATG
jgi:hypothetical protein